MIEKRKAVKFILAEPEDENRKIVSMIEFRGAIFVATQKGIYKIVKEKLVRLEFMEKEKE